MASHKGHNILWKCVWNTQRVAEFPQRVVVLYQPIKKLHFLEKKPANPQRVVKLLQHVVVSHNVFPQYVKNQKLQTIIVITVTRCRCSLTCCDFIF